MPSSPRRRLLVQLTVPTDRREQGRVCVRAPGEDRIDLALVVIDPCTVSASHLQLNPHRFISRRPCAKTRKAVSQGLQDVHAREIQIAPKPTGPERGTIVVPPRIEAFREFEPPGSGI